ncbi:MAG: ATP-binding protein [Tissierellia bacterium]|nr:ATP-binding protein [Tissierellia bacterium]
MTNKLSIEDIYRNRREQADKDRKMRIEEVYTKLPELKRIDESITALGVKAGKSIGSKYSAGILKEISKEIQSLKSSREDLLKQSGYPIDYTSLSFHCNICNDTGRVEGIGRCKCFEQLLTQRELENSNIIGMMEKENFQKFNPEVFSDELVEGYKDTPRVHMMKNKAWAEEYVLNYPNVESVLIYGGVGTGKTFLLNSMGKGLLDRGVNVVYYSSYNLMELLEDSYFNKNEVMNSAERRANLDLAQVLIIDDLGTEMINSFTQSALFNLINTRIMENRPMLISTNLSLMELKERYTERILSRIMQHFQLRQCYGPDIRYMMGFRR